MPALPGEKQAREEHDRQDNQGDVNQQLD